MLIKLAILLLKSLSRNKIRTAITGSGIVVLVAIFTVVTTVTGTVKRKMTTDENETRLIVTERWTAPSRVPLRYVPEIANLEGVKDWTTLNTVFGFLDRSLRRDHAVVALATRPENIRSMHSGLKEIPQATVDALLARKDGVLAGPGLLKSMGWEIGREFTLISASFPPVDVPFTIVGELPPGDWSNVFFCRHDYYMDATGDRAAVNAILLDVANETSAQDFAAHVNAMYENRQPALKVETESAGVSRFASRATAVLQIIDAVVGVLLIDMVIILANSISISVRERRTEMAVLKVLGFQPIHIISMVIAESMLVGGIAGMIGTGIVCAASSLTLANQVPVMIWNRFFLQFPIPWSMVLVGLAVGAAVGLIGSIFPATAARSVSVSQVFSKIA